MVMNSTPLSGLIGIIVVVVLIGTVAGLALADTDLLNFNTSAAAARAQDQETQLQGQKATSDMELYQAENAATIEKVRSDLANYKAIQAAHTQAEKDKIGLEVTARQRELDQNLALARLTRLVGLTVVALAALIVIGGLGIFLIQYGRSRVLLAQAQTTQATMWDNPIWRTEQIRQARAREILERQAALGQQAIGQSTTGGNGRYPPESEPTQVDAEQVV